MARITGIGGVFFKSSNDSTALATWYQLGVGWRPFASGSIRRIR